MNCKASIPYMGSKSKLAFKIVREIQQRHPNIENFYDLFGGGGAIILEALSHFPNIHYNEFDTSIYRLFMLLTTEGMPKSWLQPVSRQQFKEQLSQDTAYAGMVKTCWSFGNNYLKGYLYGSDIEKLKLAAHDFIVNNTEESRKLFNQISGLNISPFNQNVSLRKRRMIIANHARKYDNLQSLERIQSLISIESLPKIGHHNSNNLSYSNLSYQNVKIKPNSVIYCDPPYKDTEGYNKSKFDHEEFYQWALNSNYPIYISEYQMPEGFIVVKAFSHRSTLSATNNSNKTIEKLFWNGKGNPLKTQLF